jgi:DNA methylase
MPVRHPFHSLCPYFAMFPEDFVERHVLALTEPGDVIFDPFCGRGTTVFQSLMMGRRSFGTDVNHVAACIAGAKSDPPTLIQILQKIEVLETCFNRLKSRKEAPNAFFEHCFHRTTLQQVLFLREELNWRSSRVDRFIAAMMLGALHGESHKSARYLSNRMPRTISTKPEYSIRWWVERHLEPPERNAFAILRELARFRYRVEPARLVGSIKLGDARRAARLFPKMKQSVRLIVTSPPYLDVTDYAEDQWLRLWFLGGEPIPRTGRNSDDRLTNKDEYWTFLERAWVGVAPLLSSKSHIVVRIGGRLPVEELSAGLTQALRRAMGDRRIRQRNSPVTTDIKGRQTNNFRPGARPSVEHDFVFSIA